MAQSPTTYMFQHLKADSDNNGNPRRLYVIIGFDGNIAKVIDEEYCGFPKECVGLLELPGYEITVKEYKSILKAYST